MEKHIITSVTCFRGTLFYGEKRYKEALESFQKATTFRPSLAGMNCFTVAPTRVFNMAILVANNLMYLMRCLVVDEQ